MAGSTADSAADAGGERRVGQVLVVVSCVIALVVAGAIAPTLASPFEGGPTLNASDLDESPVEGVGGNATGGDGGGGGDALGGGGGGGSAALGQQGIGSSRESQVGGAESLAAFANQSGDVLFAVESARNTYYRVGAYRSFDGYSWSRPSGSSAFSGAVPGATPPGESFTSRVTLSAPASALPVPWQPRSIEGPSGLAVRETGGIVPRGEFSRNETFTVTAVEPTRDPEVLAASGYAYPASIREGYLDVDGNVSDRVAALADRVTADADNPYAEAVAVRDFLESNKSYSLNATTDPGRPVTEQFLFEMDAGYCQQFASTMAVMLRSQGIPARYVVGYAPGTPVGEDTYAVTGSKAHAWVEVYFEDVGWVRFDPTPAADRERADAAVANDSSVRESFRESELSDDVNASDFEPSESGDEPASGNGETADGNESDGEEAGGDEGSDGETDDGDGGGDDGGDDGEDGDDGTDDSDGESGDGTGELQVTLDRDPSPGAEVTVTVTRGGEPVLGADVYFEDEYVGRTDYRGEVTATVPYVRNLSVRVEAPNESTRRYRIGVTGDGIGAVGASAESSAAVGPEGVGASAWGPENESNETVAFAVRSEMTFEFAREPVPGASVPLRVSIDGAPVPEAEVFLGGERVGVTNESGWVRVPLPSDTRAVTVRAERGEIADEAELSLSTTVSVSLDAGREGGGESVRVVPGESVQVNATFDGEAFANGTVSIDGSEVGTTDAGGHATVEVPRDVTGSVTVTVTRGVYRGSATAGVLSNATISFERPPSPGGNVTVVVSAGGESLADATVSVAGDRTGTTAADGRATVAVPANATGSLNVSAARGSVTDAVVVDLFEPNVSVTPAYLVALPGANATVNVTDEGRPVKGATVHVGASDRADASSVGMTDASGSVEVAIPMRNAATVHASVFGATTSTRLDWLFGNLLAVVALVVAVAVVAVGAITRRGRVGAIARRVQRVARRVGRAVVRWLFAVASWLDDLVSRLPELPGRVRAFLERLASAPVRTLRELRDRLVAWLAAVATTVLAWFRDRRGGDAVAADASTAAASGDGSESAASGKPTPNEVVRAAWRALVAIVAPSRLRTRTPGEIARLARERGLRPEAVETITETYREAVYGNREPSGEAVSAVERARTEIGADPAGSVATDSSDGESTDARPRSDDGSTPTTDGGTPVSDDGSPPIDGGTPMSDDGSPTNDGETPTTDDGTRDEEGSRGGEGSAGGGE